MRLALILIAAILGFLIGLRASGSRINGNHLGFVDAYNTWQQHASKISPLSPDWREKIKAEWGRLQVREKFDLLDSEIRGE